MSTTNKRKRNDPTETSSPTIKGLNGWQIMNNPDDLIESNNKYSLEKAKGPVTNLKCHQQLSKQSHGRPGTSPVQSHGRPGTSPVQP